MVEWILKYPAYGFKSHCCASNAICNRKGHGESQSNKSSSQVPRPRFTNTHLTRPLLGRNQGGGSGRGFCQLPRMSLVPLWFPVKTTKQVPSTKLTPETWELSGRTRTQPTPVRRSEAWRSSRFASSKGPPRYRRPNEPAPPRVAFGRSEGAAGAESRELPQDWGEFDPLHSDCGSTCFEFA